jgi:hypothetical protein
LPSLSKSTLRFYIIVALVSLSVGFYYGKKQSRTEIKEVVKTQTRERVVTKINERPDGSRTTTIIENRAANISHSLQVKKDPLPEWHIALSRGLNGSQAYRVGVQYRVLPRAFIGVYGGTDREVGVSVGFEF